jgi:hypothetical protein
MGERGFLGSTTAEIGEVPPLILSEALAMIEDRRAAALWISTNESDFYEFRDASGQVKSWQIVGNDVRIYSRDNDSGSGQPILAESGETIGVDDATLDGMIALARARGIDVDDNSLPPN